MTNAETYLGDGLYASFDGWQIKLRTPRDGGDHEVYLDTQVCRAFLDFVESLKEQKPEPANELNDAWARGEPIPGVTE